MEKNKADDSRDDAAVLASELLAVSAALGCRDDEPVLAAAFRVHHAAFVKSTGDVAAQFVRSSMESMGRPLTDAERGEVMADAVATARSKSLAKAVDETWAEAVQAALKETDECRRQYLHGIAQGARMAMETVMRWAESERVEAEQRIRDANRDDQE